MPAHPENPVGSHLRLHSTQTVQDTTLPYHAEKPWHLLFLRREALPRAHRCEGPHRRAIFLQWKHRPQDVLHLHAPKAPAPPPKTEPYSQVTPVLLSRSFRSDRRGLEVHRAACLRNPSAHSYRNQSESVQSYVCKPLSARRGYVFFIILCSVGLD